MNDKELDKILSRYVITHKDGVSCRCIEGATGHLKQDFQSFLRQAELRARRDEIKLMLTVNTSHPEAYATALAIHADRRVAELEAEMGEK